MKAMVLGVGAQGSVIAKHLNEEEGVSSLVCADYSLESAERVARDLDKATAMRIDASDLNQIISATTGCTLVVNGLPPDFNLNLMRAALANGFHYQDMASGPVPGVDFVSTITRQLDLDGEFKEKGLRALIHTGSAPGLVSVLARNAADKLEEVDRVDVYIYDGIWTKRFQPFWWSPDTALGDMAAEAVNLVNGQLERVPPFNDPVMIDFVGLGVRRLVDHEHEEPVTFGLFADEAFKGCKNSTFKYGGPAVELAETLYKMGLLGQTPIKINGVEVVPFDLVCKLAPPAPSDPDSIREALSEGMELEEGAGLVRVEGRSEGKSVRIDSYFIAPGPVEAFEKHGMSHEAFLTGQAAFMFSKQLVDGCIERTGVFPPEVLEAPVREAYLNGLGTLGVEVDEHVITRLN